MLASGVSVGSSLETQAYRMHAYRPMVSTAVSGCLDPRSASAGVIVAVG
jgi:hypothetical protein